MITGIAHYGIIDNISELAFCTFVGVHDRAVLRVYACMCNSAYYVHMYVHTQCSMEQVSLNVTLLDTVTCTHTAMFTLLGSRLDCESI